MVKMVVVLTAVWAFLPMVMRRLLMRIMNRLRLAMVQMVVVLTAAVHRATVGVLPLRRARNDNTAVLPEIVDFSLRGLGIHDEDGR